MPGLLLYGFFALGLGSWLPILRLGGVPSLGALFLGGVTLMIAAPVVLHAVLGVSLFATVVVMAVCALAGVVRASLRGSISLRQLAAHPIMILCAFGAASILANGTIDYLPYTVDEFTNWIGVSRQIQLYGGYDAIRETVHLPGYTPGWRILLTLP